MAATVLDKYVTFLYNLKSYYAKRYSDDDIKSAYLSQIKSSLDDGNIHIQIDINWLGDIFDNDSQLNFDDTSYQYFFLENEKGDFVKSSSIAFSDYVTRSVSNVSNSITFTITFPQMDVENMMKDSKQLFITFKGVNIMPNDKDNRIQLQYPFSNYYAKDFPQVLTMVQEMEFSQQ